MSIRKEQKKGSSIIYLIDEENRTVTAKIPVQSMIEGAYGDCRKYNLPVNKVYEVFKGYPHKYFVGIAKCAPEDEFDIELGKRLAAARMFEKYYKTKLEIFRRTADQIDNLLTSCEDLMNNNWLALDKNIKAEVSIVFPDASDNKE